MSVWEHEGRRPGRNSSKQSFWLAREMQKQGCHEHNFQGWPAAPNDARRATSLWKAAYAGHACYDHLQLLLPHVVRLDPSMMARPVRAELGHTRRDKTMARCIISQQGCLRTARVSTYQVWPPCIALLPYPAASDGVLQRLLIAVLTDDPGLVQPR